MSRRPYTGGGCYLPTTWWFSDSAVDLDLQNNRLWTPGGGEASDFTAYVSCSRASTGYATTSSGTLTSFGTNTLRITNRGLLVEDARTNLALQSADASPTWTTSNVTVTTNQSTAPDGTTTMDKLDDGSSAGRHIIEQSITAVANTTYTVSVFAKDVDRRYVSLVWASTSGRLAMVADLQTGTITKSGIVDTLGDTVFTSAAIEQYSNNVYRLSLTGIADAAQTTLYFDVALSDTGTPTVYVSGCPSYTGSNKSVYAWGMQIEKATFPSSYIPTTSAAATRAADLVSGIRAFHNVSPASHG